MSAFQWKRLGMLSLLASGMMAYGQGPPAPVTISDARTTTLGVLSTSTAEGRRGQLYSAYVDLDGTLMFAACTTNCKQTKSWQRVKISQENLGSNIAKVQVDSRGGVHIMRLIGEHLSQMAAIYSSCAGDCLKTGNWKTTLLPGRFNVARYQLTNDWFALDRQDRPRFMTVNRYWSAANELQDQINENVVYSFCDQNCHTAANWKVVPVTSAGEMNGVIHSGVLRFDAKNRAHFMAAVDGHLTYLSCAQNCGQGSNWQGTTLRGPLGEFYRTNRTFDLTLAHNGTVYVPFTYDNGPGKPAQLWLFSCAQNCMTQAGWKQVNLSASAAFPKNLLDTGLEPAAQFANNKLLIAFQAVHQTNRPAQRLYVMTCTENCQSAQGNWKSRLAYSSETLKLPDRTPYRYMYTALHTESVLSGGQVAFTAVPHWGVNYTRLIDRPGASLVPVSDSDFQWIPIPQLVW